jgi:glyoxylase-like metal-dependent hydrolase (beta-lactamase superfamily II)
VIPIMIHAEAHGDVTRLVLTHRPSRLIGMSVSAYLVRGVLVDCGFPAIGQELEACIASRGPVRGALITHHHEDHAGNVERLARMAVPMGMSPATEAAVRSPPPLALYRRVTWGTPLPLGTPVTPFSDDDLRLVPTPGHCADHHVVWDAREGTLFAGDLFLGVRSVTVHANEQPRRLIASLRRAIALVPARMFDGHRGLVDRPMEALEARVAWLEAAIGRIEELIARGWSDRAIQREVLGRDGVARLYSAGEYSKRNFVRACRRELSTEGAQPKQR